MSKNSLHKIFIVFSHFICNGKGLTAQELINIGQIVDYLDTHSLGVAKKAIVALGKAPVNRNRKGKEQRKFWEKRVSLLFYLPLNSPEPNFAKTLWHILKGKWTRPIDYEITGCFSIVRTVSWLLVGTNLFVKYSYL